MCCRFEPRPASPVQEQETEDQEQEEEAGSRAAPRNEIVTPCVASLRASLACVKVGDDEDEEAEEAEVSDGSPTNPAAATKAPTMCRLMV